MGEAALHRNGIELVCHRFSVPDGYHAILLAYQIGDGGGRGEDADTHLAERLHQGAVIEVADDSRTNRKLFEPLQQAWPQCGILARQEQRRAVQAIREWVFVFSRQFWRGKKRETTFPEQVTESLDADSGGYGTVGNHDIQPLDRQLLE